MTMTKNSCSRRDIFILLAIDCRIYEVTHNNTGHASRSLDTIHLEAQLTSRTDVRGVNLNTVDDVYC